MPAERDKHHPAWDVYDLLRTARLNVKYCCARLNRLERVNFVMELVLAISAPSSAIAGLWFWDTAFGQYAWKVFGLVSAVTAVLRPLLGLTGKIRKYEEITTAYRALDHDLYKITVLIRQHRSFDDGLRTQFVAAIDKQGELVKRDPETKIDETLRARLTEEVLRELPAESFYLPEGDAHAATT